MKFVKAGDAPNDVPVTLGRVKLGSKPTDVTHGVRTTSSALEDRQAHGHGCSSQGSVSTGVKVYLDGSSSTSGFSRSSSVASAFSRHRSSRRLICWNEICRDRSCSFSQGGFTSQERNDRSSMRGAQRLAFHEKSLCKVV